MEPRRAGDPSRWIAKADKAREVLGWQPKHPDLESIISSAWQWHSAHPNGYDDDEIGSSPTIEIECLIFNEMHLAFRLSCPRKRE